MPATLDPARVLRARARRAHLDRSGGDVASVTRALVALHATDPATMHLSVHARQPIRPISALAADLRRALEEDRRLLRLLGMRRTLHVLERGLAPDVLTLARERLDGERRKQAAKLLDEAGAPGLEALWEQILDALEHTDLDTDALYARVPGLARRIGLAPDKTYAGEAAVGRFVLEAMGTSGELVRARSLGGWRASRTSWARLDHWIPDLPPAPPKIAAYAALARAWLRAYGPGTLDDLAWWAGLPKGDVRAALAELGPEVVQVEVRGWPGPRYALVDTELEDAGPPAPPALLPALDPSGMCWTDRSPFLDPAIARPLFDNSGNLAPTVWVDGRIVGGWACRRDGTVVFRILDEHARDAEDAVREEAARLQEALEGEVVQPRFPTPLSKELAG